ncbi:MAG: DMT family transporter [Spirochaetales bacterium]|nr:DMT family transporter [Spirochaetales bacterium]
MKSVMRLKGMSALYSAAVLFAFTSVFVKLASRSFPGTFVSAARFAVGVILCLALVIPGRRGLGGAHFTDWLFRGVFGALSMAATYAAISLTGPGRATLLTNIYPLFVVVFGALFFGERPGIRIVASLALAIGGVALVVRDGSGSSLPGDALALTGAVFAGLAVNFVRRASHSGCDPIFLYLSPSLLGLPLFFLAPLPSVAPTGAAILFLVAVGIGAFMAQLLMTTGYRSIPAGQGSVVFFAETGLTVLLGTLIAGEIFTIRFLAGLVLIVFGLWLNRARSIQEKRG